MDEKEKWDVPCDEEGLRELLSLRDAAQKDGDRITEAQALLKLSHLVKWVRSDNEQHPFDRSHTLALQSLAMFRELGDKVGIISALLLAVPFESRDSSSAMLVEAQALAGELGDDYQLARVISAHGRQVRAHDKELALRLTHDALDLFRNTGSKSGMASCLFSLAISDGTPEEKTANAWEAARLYRESGNRRDSCKAAVIALMNAERSGDVTTLEPQVQATLVDAQLVADHHTEARCYGYLAKIAEAKGDSESVSQYRRWEADLNESDGLTPFERTQQNIKMTEFLIAMAEKKGDRETAHMFQEQLRKLQQEDLN